MVDLNEPDGLSDEERVAWLRGVGEALVAETGQPQGVTEHQPGRHGQPVWAMWWTEGSADPEPSDDHNDRRD